MYRLETDCEDYHVLTNAVKHIKDIPGIVCEIGTRRGGSLKIIVDSLLDNLDYDRNVISLDPYGNIEYVSSEGERVRYDYTNDMRNETIVALYQYLIGKPVNVVMYILEDTEFFDRFHAGVPFYRDYKTVLNTYSLVFFDGPHDVAAVLKEMQFFLPRSTIGTVWVIDDIHVFPYESIKNMLLDVGFELLEESRIKASFKKIK